MPIQRTVYYTYWENTEPPWDHGNVPWILRIAVRWVMTVLGFIAAEWAVNNVFFDEDRWFTDGTGAILLAAAIYVAMRAVLRPILIFLTCPLQIITLGLFMFVVNALIVMATEVVCEWFDIGFVVDGFWPALWGALIISLVTFALSRFLRRNPYRRVML
jgi:putative membrane protein